MKRLLIVVTLLMLITGTVFCKSKDYLSVDAEVQFKLDDSDITGD